MAITVANTANTNSFAYWLARTNELADAMTNKVVTVNSNTATGNAQVNGHIFSVGLNSNTLSGGNTSTVTVLTVSSNVLIATENTLTVGNSSVNVFMNSSTISIGSISVNSSGISSNSVSITPVSINVVTTGTSVQLIDSFSKSTYQGGEYILSIKNNGANGYQISKVLLIHNVGDTHLTEYGLVYTNNQLGQISANANSTHCCLYCTPTETNTQIKGLRTLIVV